MTSPITPSLPDALRACIEAFAVATPGAWEWSENGNILGHMPDDYEETREVAAVYTERDDDLAPKDAVAILAAENLIRQHGPALEQSLRSLADENQALLRGVASSDAPTSSQAPPSGELHQQADAWMPIESAPKDGTQILATWGDTWAQSGPHIEVCEMGDEGGWFYSYDGDAPSSKPTHWMPVPAGPNGANGDVETLRVAQPTGDSP